MIYSDNKSNKKILNVVNKFKDLVNRAKEEHERTIEGPIDQGVRSEGLTPNADVTQDIASNVTDDIESLVEERVVEVVKQARGICD